MILQKYLLLIFESQNENKISVCEWRTQRTSTKCSSLFCKPAHLACIVVTLLSYLRETDTFALFSIHNIDTRNAHHLARRPSLARSQSQFINNLHTFLSPIPACHSCVTQIVAVSKIGAKLRITFIVLLVNSHPRILFLFKHCLNNV